MRSLCAAELLTLWETGQRRSSVERALLLLEAAWPELGREALAGLTIGERDSRLLTLRERVFGPTLASLSTCPACGGSLEQTFGVDDIRVAERTAPPAYLSVEVDGRLVRFRLPTSEDLAAIAPSGDITVSRARLVERCLADTGSSGAPAVTLSEPLLRAIADRMEDADPAGDIQLALSCPLCSRDWVESFDIVSYFWSELAAWSARLFDQVHRLASAYGWRETDILAMSAGRREVYLARCGP